MTIYDIDSLKPAAARLGVAFAAIASVALGACSNAPTCDELAFYETANGGRRIVAPEDLDGLDEYKEMVIPEASPRPPRDLTAGCLDRPPTLRLGRSEEE